MTSVTQITKTAPIVPSGIRKVTFAEHAARLLCWYDRARQRRQLKNLDEHMLDDIGVTCTQAEAEARKPGWHT